MSFDLGKGWAKQLKDAAEYASRKISEEMTKRAQQEKKLKQNSDDKPEDPKPPAPQP